MSGFATEPLAFTAARDWLARKADLPTELNSAEIANAAPGAIRMQAFFSAKVAGASILENFRSQVEDVAAGKIGYGEARKRMTEFLASQGVGIPAPGDGDDKDVRQLGSTARLDLVLRQNVAMAHAIGQREVSEHPAVMELYPNYKYLAVMDENTRDSHADLNGLVLPKTDPFWATHFPPWEFNCRCMAIDTDEPVNGKSSGFNAGGSTVQGSTVEDDGAQTGAVQLGTRTLNLLPNRSGFVFRSDPAEAFGEPDFGRIRNQEVREIFQSQWEKKAAEFGMIGKHRGPSSGDVPFESVGLRKPLEGLPVTVRAALESEEAHNATLNEERLAVVGPNGTVRDTVIGRPGKVIIPADVARRMAGCVATHYHRSGEPFSTVDFIGACRTRLAELRATTPAGVYVLKAVSGNMGEHLLQNARKDIEALDRGYRQQKPESVARWLHEQWKTLAQKHGFSYGYHKNEP